MTRSGIFAGCFILVAAAFSDAALFGQEARKPVKVEESDEISVARPEPIRVFTRFESAWRTGNAQALADLAGASPVLVELHGYDRRGGYFTKAQLLYIFKDLFRTTKQLEFGFVRYHNIEKQDRRVYGIAQRSYRSGSSAGLLRDKVYVTLVKEDTRWALAEIKSTW